MYRQIDEYLHKYNLLTERQSGFRSKRSCVTALIDVTEYIRETLDENMVSFLVLLDHSKAFDNVNHKILITKLNKLFNFSNSASKLISNYLANRSQIVCCNEQSSNALTTNKGVPQGSILGPLLSTENLGVVFNETLSWNNHISSVIGKVYGMLRNLWAVQSSTPVHIRMLLAKTYLIPVLMYGCELFANCNSTEFAKLNTAFNSIARYIFNKKRFDSISNCTYKIFNMSLKNYLKLKCLIQLHKIIYTKEPSYLYNKLVFGRSNRGVIIIQLRYKTSMSEKHFLICTIRLWNNLPRAIQIICNAFQFKKELKKYFS